jgi:hypothetical protein
VGRVVENQSSIAKGMPMKSGGEIHMEYSSMARLNEDLRNKEDGTDLKGDRSVI